MEFLFSMSHILELHFLWDQTSWSNSKIHLYILELMGMCRNGANLPLGTMKYSPIFGSLISHFTLQDRPFSSPKSNNFLLSDMTVKTGFRQYLRVLKLIFVNYLSVERPSSLLNLLVHNVSQTISFSFFHETLCFDLN